MTSSTEKCNSCLCESDILYTCAWCDDLYCSNCDGDFYPMMCKICSDFLYKETAKEVKNV